MSKEKKLNTFVEEKKLDLIKRKFNILINTKFIFNY